MPKSATILVVAAMSIWCLCPFAVRAGNPLQTNDPETPGSHGWEINLSQNLELTRPALAQTLPLVNVNYGCLDNDQWKISVPLLEIDPRPGEEHWGVGDIQIGRKYRFLEEDERGVQASVYPQPLLPTGNASLELGDDRLELFLPVEVGKHFFDDKLFLYGEVGHNFVFDGSRQHSWFFGAAAEYQATEKIEIVSEIGHLLFPFTSDADNLFFNAGANLKLTKHVFLQTAFGRSLLDEETGVPFFSSYVGLQIVWGGHEVGEMEDTNETSKAQASSLLQHVLRR